MISKGVCFLLNRYLVPKPDCLTSWHVRPCGNPARILRLFLFLLRLSALATLSTSLYHIITPRNAGMWPPHRLSISLIVTVTAISVPNAGLTRRGGGEGSTDSANPRWHGGCTAADREEGREQQRTTPKQRHIFFVWMRKGTAVTSIIWKKS